MTDYRDRAAPIGDSDALKVRQPYDGFADDEARIDGEWTSLGIRPDGLSNGGYRLPKAAVMEALRWLSCCAGA